MTGETDAILGAAAVPMVLIDRGGMIAGLSRPAADIWGHATRGRHFSGIFRAPEFAAGIEAALSRGQAGQATTERWVNGRTMLFHATIAPVSRLGVLVTLVDLSAELAAGRSRSEFVANVSHELRTPLTAITGAIETLQDSARGDAEAQAAFLEMIAREAARMNRLVQDLLSLSRVENEGARRFEPVDICAVIWAAADTLGDTAAGRGVRVVVGDGCEGGQTVVGDPDQLRQLFLNLIENAIKYGHPNAEVRVTVSGPDVQAVLARPGIRIDVIDRGEGIAEEHIARLTERFFRVDTHRSRETGGTGLGLAIVKHIVAGHGGRLRISSEIGSGSVFSVFLPVPRDRGADRAK